MTLRVRRWIAVLGVFMLVCPAAGQRRRVSQARPERLDAGIEYRRDAVTGELRVVQPRSSTAPAEENAPSAPPPGAIRVSVELVDVSLNVVDPAAPGQPVRGLAREDFRIFEDGAEHPIVHFDAATQPASVALVMDASPSVVREFRQMQLAARALAAELAAQDEVAVVGFAAHTYLLLPFTRDRAQLERAIDSLDVLRDEGRARGSHIYEAVFLAARELFAGRRPDSSGRRGRKAIVLLTDGQDSQLGLGWDARSAEPRGDRLTFEDLCRALTFAGVEVHVVSNQNRPRAMTDHWLANNRPRTLVTPAAREKEMTHYTLWLAELMRRAGGGLYFLSELGGLENAYRLVAERIRAQYTLGYYPREGFARPGWRALRIEVRGRPELHLTHRVAYFVPARRGEGSGSGRQEFSGITSR